MKTGRRRLPCGRFAKLAFTALGFALSQSGQQFNLPTGYSTDWTSHYLVFSSPGSIFEAARAGKLDHWGAIVGDPHYRMQLMRRSPRQVGDPIHRRPVYPADTTVDKDWSAELTSSGSGVLPNTFPAKFSFSATSAPDCTADFVVYPAGHAGSSSAASIVAFNNLYSGCASGTVPSVLWAYNTGGTATSSPILSYDSTGSQVAFVQNSSTSLVLLKWAASGGTITSPASITAVTAANYRTCTAPCYVAIPLSGSPTAKRAPPFPDYAHDTIYVGDDSGKIHQFTGVFNGTPAETTTTPWPVNATSGAFIFGLVYDPASGNLFTDASATLYSVGTGYQGTTAGQVTVAGSVGSGITDTPLVDSSAGKLYLFPSAGNSHSVSSKVTVVQFPVTFASGAFGSGTSSPSLGTSGSHFYAGIFDNVYYSSSNQTGNLYAMGNVTSAGETLYQIPISAGTMGTPVAISGLAGLNKSESRPTTAINGYSPPLTEFCNGAGAACGVSGGETTTGTDYLFLSGAPGAGSGCTQAAIDGCVMSLNISNPASVSVAGTGLNIAFAAASSCFATSGIVVDNSATSGTLAGASQIYFINLDGNDSTACASGTGKALYAVQASQSAP